MPHQSVFPWTHAFGRHAIPDDRSQTSPAITRFSSTGETVRPDPDHPVTSAGRRVAVGGAVDLGLRGQIALRQLVEVLVESAVVNELTVPTGEALLNRAAVR